MSVAESKALKVLHRLLEVGVSFKADQEGLTALHYAAFAGSEEAAPRRKTRGVFAPRWVPSSGPRPS